MPELPSKNTLPAQHLIYRLESLIMFDRDQYRSEFIDHVETLAYLLTYAQTPELITEAQDILSHMDEMEKSRATGAHLSALAGDVAAQIGMADADDVDGILAYRLRVVTALGPALKDCVQRNKFIADAQRNAAREFWQARREVSATPATCTERDTQQEISECTDVVNYLLALAGCPPEHRAFLDALIGAYHEQVKKPQLEKPDKKYLGCTDLSTLKGWFEGDDFTIGKRMRGTTHVSLQAVRKVAQRARQAFNQWQLEAGYDFVQLQLGGKRNGKNYKTQYRLLLLEVAAEALEQARSHRLWAINPGKAIKEEAKMGLDWKLKESPTVVERFNRPRTDPEATMTRRHHTVMTLVRQNLETIQMSGGDVDAYLTKLTDELRGLTPSLSTHVLNTCGQAHMDREIDL